MDLDQILRKNEKRIFWCQLVVFGLSFVHLFAGIMDVAVGAAAYYQLVGMHQFIEIETAYLIMVIIVGGACVLLFISGFKGANTDKAYILVVHSICTLNFFLISIMMTVLCTTTRNRVGDAPNHFDVLITAFQNYRKNETFIDDIQTKYHCCGPNYDGYKYWNDSIPASCYKDRDSILVSIRWTISILREHGVEKVSDIIYTGGCTEEFLRIVKDLLFYTTVMNYMSIIALFIGFIFSVALCVLKIQENSIRYEPEPLPECVPQTYTSTADLPPAYQDCVPQTYMSSADLPPAYQACINLPPSYIEAVSALQVMESDLQIPEFIEMNDLSANPPAYEDIDFSS